MVITLCFPMRIRPATEQPKWSSHSRYLHRQRERQSVRNRSTSTSDLISSLPNPNQCIEIRLRQLFRKSMVVCPDSATDRESAVQGRLRTRVAGQDLYPAPLEYQSGEVRVVSRIAGVELHGFINVVSVRRVSKVFERVTVNRTLRARSFGSA